VGSGLERAAEEKIRQAMEAGEFDHLAGYGKPIDWKDNPFAPAGWQIAFDLLQKNGFLLPWMDTRREIEAEIIRINEQCTRNLRNHPEMARNEFFKQVEAVNRKIFDYNLSVPAASFQRKLLKAQAEFDLLKQP
jgi:hypothetical protein